MKKFFEVVAKCGHVGRDKYYEGRFYVSANNGKDAASIVRNMGRVKHNHKDAIIRVTEISYYDYKLGIEKKQDEIYFNCNSKFEQKKHMDQIMDYLKKESSKEFGQKRENSNKDIYDGKIKVKNPRKYYKFNLKCEAI